MRLVGDERAAIADAIDEDAAVDGPAADRQRRRLHEVREITAVPLALPLLALAVAPLVMWLLLAGVGLSVFAVL